MIVKFEDFSESQRWQMKQELKTHKCLTVVFLAFAPAAAKTLLNKKADVKVRL